VRVIGKDGEMLGILQTRQARTIAEQQGLDLVEVQPMADPPVCRIMDFGKFRYDESRKEKLARKNQHAQVLKEIKFHPNVAEHDYATKVNHVREFLEKGHKVKISLIYRGREMAHRELGAAVVNRIIKDCADLSNVESVPKLMGRNLMAVLVSKGAKH
jgi:translation initiation factor IF-3